MFIARDLESKESLRNLRRPAYIIAHKQVLTDIGPLIDRNIAFIHDKGRELLEDLEDGMSFDQWIYAFCQREKRPHPERVQVQHRGAEFCQLRGLADGRGEGGGAAGILRQALFHREK